MKKHLIVTFLSFAFIFTACEKDEIVTPDLLTKNDPSISMRKPGSTIQLITDVQDSVIYYSLTQLSIGGTILNIPAGSKIVLRTRTHSMTNSGGSGPNDIPLTTTTKDMDFFHPRTGIFAMTGEGLEIQLLVQLPGKNNYIVGEKQIIYNLQ